MHYDKSSSSEPKLFRPKEYFGPAAVEEAISLLVNYGARGKIIAGGTDVLVMKPPECEYLIDITRLPLDYIKIDKDDLRIGALATFRSIETSEALENGGYELLTEAAHEMGSVPIRNVATVGGNICNALPSSEICPALVALDSKVKIVGSSGERVIPLEEFFIGARKTVLKSDELLTEIQVPKPPAHTGTAFQKIGRTAEDLSMVNAAVRVTLREDGVCKEARIVIGGGVAPTLVRSKRAEALLERKKIESALIEKAALAASKGCCPRPASIRGSPSYKIEVSKVLVRRALDKALERVNGR